MGGGTVGLVGGAATGYGAYTKRKEICTGAEGAWSKAKDCGEYIQARATGSKEFVQHHCMLIAEKDTVACSLHADGQKRAVVVVGMGLPVLCQLSTFCLFRATSSKEF